MKHEMRLRMTPGGLAEVAEHSRVPSVAFSLGKAAAVLLLLGPCRSSCPASLQYHLLPAAWFCPSMFGVLGHPTSVSDCPPAELTSRALVGLYVPAAAPGTTGMRGKGSLPWGWCLMGKRRTCAHTILHLLNWESSSGRLQANMAWEWYLFQTL